MFSNVSRLHTVVSCFSQNLVRLCCVVTQCVAAFSVDFWLQTNMYQSGVLWHLLQYLFNYDFTLEEGGVEKSHQTNQQVHTGQGRTNHTEITYNHVLCYQYNVLYNVLFSICGLLLQ